MKDTGASPADDRLADIITKADGNPGLFALRGGRFGRLGRAGCNRKGGDSSGDEQQTHDGLHSGRIIE